MDACTFQPNVPRQGVAGTIGSGSCLKSSKNGRDGDGVGVGGDGDGSGGDGHGEGGEGILPDSTRVAGEGGRLSRAAATTSKGSADPPRRSLDRRAVTQRLFEETGRLDERRFEGQERKRMWEEEVYARTCTFEVSRGHSPEFPRGNFLASLVCTVFRPGVSITDRYINYPRFRAICFEGVFRGVKCLHPPPTPKKLFFQAKRSSARVGAIPTQPVYAAVVGAVASLGLVDTYGRRHHSRTWHVIKNLSLT